MVALRSQVTITITTLGSMAACSIKAPASLVVICLIATRKSIHITAVRNRRLSTSSTVTGGSMKDFCRREKAAWSILDQQATTRHLIRALLLHIEVPYIRVLSMDLQCHLLLSRSTFSLSTLVVTTSTKARIQTCHRPHLPRSTSSNRLLLPSSSRSRRLPSSSILPT